MNLSFHRIIPLISALYHLHRNQNPYFRAKTSVFLGLYVPRQNYSIWTLTLILPFELFLSLSFYLVITICFLLGPNVFHFAHFIFFKVILSFIACWIFFHLFTKLFFKYLRLILSFQIKYPCFIYFSYPNSANT